MTPSRDSKTELTITKMGKMGDGIAQHEGKALFIPLTCPGDVVLAEIEHEAKHKIRAKHIEITHHSASRQTPPCQYFGRCGGCSLQHLNKATYYGFKQTILENIITEIGAEASVIKPLIDIGPHSRRRVEFKIALRKGEIQIGFFGAKTHEVIALKECLISEDRLVGILPALKQCLQRLGKPGIIKALNITILDAGLDAIILTRSPIGNDDRQALINFAKEQHIIRLSQYVQAPESSRGMHASKDSHILYDNGQASISFAGIDVFPPVGTFLQATSKGEAAITELVTTHLKGCHHIADLYSGCGTYSFPLIRQTKRVSTFEGQEEMTLATHNAITKHHLGNQMASHTRDLFKHPLKKEELNHFDGILINPPRAGALPQIKAIGKSNVNKVVMVSCNPTTFKRDGRHLLESGYHLTMATAIDQFYWSGHLELVAVFER